MLQIAGYKEQKCGLQTGWCFEAARCSGHEVLTNAYVADQSVLSERLWYR